jgi:NodT family efflux transporter outer membrane factor (OMF) lipoprotein
VKKIIFLLLVLEISACAVFRQEDSSDSVETPLIQDGKIASTWSKAVPDGPMFESWVQTFQSPALEAIIQEALKNNLDLQTAQARLEASAASARIAGAAANPFVGVNGGLQTIGTINGKDIDNRSAAVNLSWEIDLWGKIKNEKKSAKFKFEADSMSYLFARQSLAAATAKSWFLCIEMFQQKNMAKSNLMLAERNLKVLEDRLSFGKSSSSEVALARSEVAIKNEKLSSVENAYGQAQRSLEVLLGRYPSAEIEIDAQFPKVLAAVPAGLPSELLERRPDVQAAEMRLKSAFYKLKAQKLARLPQLSLTAALGAPSALLKNLLGGGSTFFKTGANFLFPVFDGGQRKEAVKIATSEQKAALAMYSSAALNAFKEVENALSNEVSINERIGSESTAVKELEKVLKIRKVEQGYGKSDILTVLLVETQLNQHKSYLITLQNFKVSERVNLFLALGGAF